MAIRRNIPYPSPAILKDNIVDAIRQSGWNPLILSTTRRCPFDLSLFQGEQSHRLKVYLWNLSPGGNNRPANERRIQIHTPQFALSTAFETLILGWSGSLDVFAAFDVRKHAGPLGKSPSFQITQETLEAATDNGFCAQSKDNEEIVVAFRPELFADYVTNREAIHDLGEEAVDFQALEKLVEQSSGNTSKIKEENIALVSQERLTIIREVSRKVRQSSFQRRVLTAYSHKCAFCGVQLKLVDAAHIVPVSISNSTDETCNGIALCALHHRAFDFGLITFQNNYDIVHNAKKMTQLRNLNLSGGDKGFLSALKQRIALPPDPRDRPRLDYLNQANTLRGWS